MQTSPTPPASRNSYFIQSGLTPARQDRIQTETTTHEVTHVVQQTSDNPVIETASPAEASSPPLTPLQTPASANFDPTDPRIQATSFPAPATAAATPASDTVAPASLPEPLRESYLSLGSRLRSDPQINYIDIGSPERNRGLAEFLNRFKTQLDSVPGLREKLAQTDAGRQLLDVLENAARGNLSSQDILKLQTFIVSAGENISHPNSASGIDGAYGPRTHQGLQNAFARLLEKPDETIGQFAHNYSAAYEQAQAQINDYNNMGGDVPAGGYTEPAAATPSAPGSTVPAAGAGAPLPPINRETTDTGRQILAAVDRTRGPMRAYLAQHGGFYCYRGVKQVLQQLRPPVNLTGGSAYMAADQLRSRYSDRFQEVRLSVPPDQRTQQYLRSLPAGAIVVWGASNDPALREAGRRAGNGYAHGHISVALGNGYEFSDRDRPQITGSRDPARYGSLTVFLPRDTAQAPAPAGN